MSRSRTLGFAGLIVLFAAVLPARADQIASHINGSDNGVWGIVEYFWSAVPFTTDGNPWTVDNVVAPVQQQSHRSLDGIFMQVYTDNAGLPGSPLGSRMETPTISDVVSNQTFTRVGAAASLSPGTTYWMVLGVDVPSSDANPIYRRTNQTPGDGPGVMGLGLRTSLNDGGSWAYQNPNDANFSVRMQINGVPEPASLGLIALALPALLRRRR